MNCYYCEHALGGKEPVYCNECRDDIEHENGRYVIEACEAKAAAHLTMAKLAAFATRVERLAFEMPAPNPWTPRFIELVVASTVSPDIARSARGGGG